MSNPSDIFPLPFTPFEHFCYALTDPQTPMTFWAKFTFKGRFNREFFHQALGVALERHPLFQALVHGEPGDQTKNISWVYAPQMHPWVDWGVGEATVLPAHGEYIDLRREVGLRFFFRECDNENKLFIQTHHSCCDGLRFLEFFDDLLTVYARLHPDTVENPNLRPQNLELLKKRGKFRFGRITRILMISKNILQVLKFFKTKITPILHLGNGKALNQTSLQEPSYLAHTFSEAQTKKILATAKSRGVSVYDLLLRDLFLTLNDWNGAEPTGEEEHTYRIAVPTDLAYALNASMPSANKVGMIFLDRKITGSTSQEMLLKGIHSEMKHLRKWNLGYSLVRALEVLGRKKERLSKVLRKVGFIPTIYFTTLGSLFNGSSLLGPEGRLVAGNLEMLGMDSIAPAVPWSPMNIIAASYRGKLKICLRFNGQKAAPDQAEKFLNLFISRSSKYFIN